MKKHWRIGREWRLPAARFNNDGTDNGDPTPVTGGAILQETGDDILQETGDRLLQEA